MIKKSFKVSLPSQDISLQEIKDTSEGPIYNANRLFNYPIPNYQPNDKDILVFNRSLGIWEYARYTAIIGLTGPKGDAGIQGPAGTSVKGDPGEKGNPGADGKDAVGLTKDDTRQNIYGGSKGTLSESTNSVIFGMLAGESASVLSNSVAIGTGAMRYGGNTNSNSVAVGSGALSNFSNTDSIAIGYNSSQNGNSGKTVSIGSYAGAYNQSLQSIAIGYNSGYTNQNTNSVAIGPYTGAYNQSEVSVAIGYNSGKTSQATQSVAIGYMTGAYNQARNCIAIGYLSGNTSQGSGSVSIGGNTGSIKQAGNCVAIGVSSGKDNQQYGSVAVGVEAGMFSQGSGCVAIGFQTATTRQGNQCIAIGQSAGSFNQLGSSISIGESAGYNVQGVHSIAIGYNTAHENQGNSAVAIGERAGYNKQGDLNIAIGYEAQRDNALERSLAVGVQAGMFSQGTYCTAVGYQAGHRSQGSYSTSLGWMAGQEYQHNNTLILNGSGIALNSKTSNATYIKPIRNLGTSNLLQYDNSTGEVVYGNVIVNTSTTDSKFTISGSITSTTYESFLQFSRCTGNNNWGSCADIGLYRFDNTLGASNSVLGIKLAYQNTTTPDLNILTLSSYNGGRVGINNTSPATTLDVNGTATIRGVANINGSVTITGSANNSTPNVPTTNNPPESMLKLFRPGLGGTTFGSTVEFNVSRNQNAAQNSSSNGGASVLDIKMSQNTGSDNPDTIVATFFANGRVGINNTSPVGILDVYSYSTYSVFKGIAASNATAKDFLSSTGKNAIADTTSGALATTMSGSTFFFYGKHLGNSYSATLNGSTLFTGQHANIPITCEETLKTNISVFVGLIVCSANEGYYSINPITNEIVTGKNAIQINESLPKIKLSRVYKDKTVWGVITNYANEKYNPDGTIHLDGDEFWKDRIDTLVRVNGLGEGAIWVCNANGNIENGDYITSCTVPGYGTRQDTDSLKNYTVAKATCSVDFTSTTLNDSFQIRFLLPDGTNINQTAYNTALTNNQTVYISAFIGCSYHCS